MIERFVVSRDDEIYEAWPDVTRTRSGRLVCVFSECTHHSNRSYTRIMHTHSTDRGRTWSPKRPLSEPLRGDPRVHPYWNCARVVTLSDGRLAAVCDRVTGRQEGRRGEQSNWLWFSDDDGEVWTGPHATPLRGIVPDRLIELTHSEHAGRWILSATRSVEFRDELIWVVAARISDDQGRTWSKFRPIACPPGLQLCEPSVLELPGGELVCFLREDSRRGLDCYKALSLDGGWTWEGPYLMPIPACHRPVAGMLRSGRVMITHRYMQAGKSWLGWATQNLLAAVTDVESCLARRRSDARTRIMPLDFDRSSLSDTGYSGWVQFDDGEIYVVNYILDDAPKAQIRGLAFDESDFLLPSAEGPGTHGGS